MSALQAPALDRLWAAVRERRERRGADGDAVVLVEDLAVEEAAAIDALPWSPTLRQRVLPGSDFRIRLSRIEEAVRQAGDELTVLLERHHDMPLRDLPAERRQGRAQRTELWEWIAAQPAFAAWPALDAWLERTKAHGLVGPDDRPALEIALRAVAVLPFLKPISRGVLAAQCAGGDAHALDMKYRAARLVLGMLQTLDGRPDADLDASAQHELWLRFGVEPDPLSPTVLALGLRPSGEDPLAHAIRALCGGHTVMTLMQLREARLQWPATPIAFVCENPAVVRAAERELGGQCPPLVCTAGWPNSAVMALLRNLRESNVELRHHGDFDEDGIGIHRHLEKAVGARRWRFDSTAYLAALARLPRPLPPVPEPRRLGDGELEHALLRERLVVMEELLIDDLVGDLAKHAAR